MQCKYLDIECDKISINDKQCAYCLSLKNVEMIKTLNDRMDAFEKPTKKVTGRKPVTKKVTGRT